jgi:hypothetical protein
MEPTPKTFELIGRLCAGWAYLESLSEATIWGVLEIDVSLGKIITWPKDLTQMWTLLISEAPSRLTEDDVMFLKAINKKLVDLTKDRNIVVHGVVTAQAIIDEPAPEPYSKVTPKTHTIPPAWTVFRGQHAGKRFPISEDAVEIIYSNILKVCDELSEFNARHGFRITYFPYPEHNDEWPKRL